MNILTSFYSLPLSLPRLVSPQPSPQVKRLSQLVADYNQLCRRKDLDEDQIDKAFYEIIIKVNSKKITSLKAFLAFLERVLEVRTFDCLNENDQRELVQLYCHQMVLNGIHAATPLFFIKVAKLFKIYPPSQFKQEAISSFKNELKNAMRFFITSTVEYINEPNQSKSIASSVISVWRLFASASAFFSKDFQNELLLEFYRFFQSELKDKKLKWEVFLCFAQAKLTAGFTIDDVNEGIQGAGFVRIDFSYLLKSVESLLTISPEFEAALIPALLDSAAFLDEKNEIEPRELLFFVNGCYRAHLRETQFWEDYYENVTKVLTLKLKAVEPSSFALQMNETQVAAWRKELPLQVNFFNQLLAIDEGSRIGGEMRLTIQSLFSWQLLVLLSRNEYAQFFEDWSKIKVFFTSGGHQRTSTKHSLLMIVSEVFLLADSSNSRLNANEIERFLEEFFFTYSVHEAWHEEAVQVCASSCTKGFFKTSLFHTMQKITLFAPRVVDDEVIPLEGKTYRKATVTQVLDTKVKVDVGGEEGEIELSEFALKPAFAQEIDVYVDIDQSDPDSQPKFSIAGTAEQQVFIQESMESIAKKKSAYLCLVVAERIAQTNNLPFEFQSQLLKELLLAAFSIDLFELQAPCKKLLEKLFKSKKMNMQDSVVVFEFISKAYGPLDLSFMWKIWMLQVEGQSALKYSDFYLLLKYTIELHGSPATWVDDLVQRWERICAKKSALDTSALITLWEKRTQHETVETIVERYSGYFSRELETLQRNDFNLAIALHWIDFSVQSIKYLHYLSKIEEIRMAKLINGIQRLEGLGVKKMPTLHAKSEELFTLLEHYIHVVDQIVSRNLHHKFSVKARLADLFKLLEGSCFNPNEPKSESLALRVWNKFFLFRPLNSHLMPISLLNN
jgi:hypothetical protein